MSPALSTSAFQSLELLRPSALGIAKGACIPRLPLGALRNTEELGRGLQRGARGRQGKRNKRKFHVVPVITGWREGGESPGEAPASQLHCLAISVGTAEVSLGPDLS
jgi:hypothetical protein